MSACADFWPIAQAAGEGMERLSTEKKLRPGECNNAINIRYQHFSWGMPR